MLDILEATGINGRSTSEAITEKSGYNIWTTRRAIRILHNNGWVARLGVKSPLYKLTESGKIALAIWHGRQHRAAIKRRRQQHEDVLARRPVA